MALYQSTNSEQNKKKKTSFKYYSCYLVLSKIDKWRTTYIPTEKKKWKEAQEKEKMEAKARKALASIPVALTIADNDDNEDPDARPIGRKKAKTSKSVSHQAGLEEIRRMHEESALMDREILAELKRQNDLKERELALQEKRLLFEMKSSGYVESNNETED